MRLWNDSKVFILRCLGKLRRWIIGPYGIAVLSRSENGLLLAPADDLMVGRRLCFNGRYDPELLEFFLEKCDARSQVLFVGAHVGALVVPVARKARKIVAIEANPTTLDLLQKNIMLNGLQNVEVHGFAAGDRRGEVSFLAARLNSGGSGLEMGDRRTRSFFCEERERMIVQMKMLDDVFSDRRFDFIVIDIEGSESLALRGMHKLLQNCRGLLIEVFQDHLKTAGVSNEQFLALIAPFFDEAVILPEKPRRGVAPVGASYQQSAFPEMMRECRRLRMANVMFWKETHNNDGADPKTHGFRKNSGGAEHKVHENSCHS